MRFDGILTSWNDERGFGFIAPTQGGQEIFVHIKAFRSLRERPQVNQRVSFQVELNPQGKKRATNVEVARPRREPLPAPRRSSGSVQWGTASLFVIPIFAVILLLGHVLGQPPRWLLWAYLGGSAVTFLAYAMDKSAAQRGAWRIKEQTLHLLSLAGGWPGALLAQQMLRHKSAKAEFRAVFWATVALNIVGFVVLSSPAASALFR